MTQLGDKLLEDGKVDSYSIQYVNGQHQVTVTSGTKSGTATAATEEDAQREALASLEPNEALKAEAEAVKGTTKPRK